MGRFAGTLPLVFTALLALLGGLPEAYGDDETDARRAVAIQFFEDGRRLEQDGLPDEARDKFEKAAKAAKEAGELDAEAAALRGRLRCQFLQHDFKGMIATLERLLEVETELGRTVKAIETESDLGAILIELGSFDSARKHLESALSGLRRQKQALDRALSVEATEDAKKDLANDLGKNAVARAFTLTHLADVSARQRSYATALDLAEAAERLFREVKNDQDRWYAQELIAGIHVELGAYERAEALLNNMVEEQAAGSAHRALALGNLGFAQYRMDRLDAAASSLDKALAIFRKTDARVDMARALIHRGEVEERRGNAARALATYREALKFEPGNREINVKIGDALLALSEPDVDGARDNYALALYESSADLQIRTDALRGLAHIALLEHAPRTALMLANDALTALETFNVGLADEQTAFAQAHFPKVLSIALRSAVEVGEPHAISEVLERTRAATAPHDPGVADVSAADREREFEAREAVVKAQMRYYDAQDEGLLKTIRERRAQYNAAVGAYRDVLESIERASKRVGTRRLAHIHAHVLQRELDESSALVQYVLRDGIAGALVVTQEEIRWIELDDVDRIRSTCEELWTDLVEGAPSSSSAILQRAKRQLVKPLGLPSSLTRVYVSPDDGVAKVPFALLLPDHVATSFVQSGTVLAQLVPARQIRGEHALLVADPEYSVGGEGNATRVYAGGTRLSPLPHSRRSAVAVKRHGDRLLLGREASETQVRRLLDEMGRIRVIQFGCHGILNTESPNLSSLALSPDSSHDGFLNEVELPRLDFDADLVLLSACNTARGRSLQGVSLRSLARAFMAAGAPRVIASLWPVDDAATSALMIKLHEELRKDGVSTAEALRRAQDHVRSKKKRWKAPKYWAAWVIWGLPD